MTKVPYIILLAALSSARLLACSACQDRDVFKDAFVAKANSAAEAAASAASSVPAAGPAPVALAAPRERVLDGSAPAAAEPSEELLSRKPTLHIRSFNELK
jgi:hypothetical protein